MIQYSLEGSLFPWSRNGKIKQKALKIAFLQAIKDAPFEQGAFLYFKGQLGQGFILPMYNEYAVQRMFYDKFGIGPAELGELDAHWVDIQILLMNAEAKARQPDM